ncbi:MAG: DNA repair protein RadC [Sphaerochaetaceae bacterium]
MKYEENKLLNLDIKEIEVCERPRERLELNSAKNLCDLELLMILLGSGSKSRPVRLIAQDLLELLDKNLDVDREAIDKIEGIGLAKSCIISAALELGRRKGKVMKKQIISPSDLYPVISHYAQRLQEQFLAINLNGAHEVLSINVVSLGTVSRTLVHPREVFAEAIVQRASAIIVAHNHPSGNLTPSVEDLDITKRLKQAGEILGIRVLDHLIISEEGYYSLLEGQQF